MRWKTFAVFAFVMLSGCGLAGAPNEQGLRPGKYRVQFDIVASAGLPSIIVGHHDFTFGVVTPTTQIQSFKLLAAKLGTQDFYLASEANETVPTLSSWAVSWRLTLNESYRVSVVLNEETGGNFSFPTGCHVLSESGSDYVGTNCSVARAD